MILCWCRNVRRSRCHRARVWSRASHFRRSWTLRKFSVRPSPVPFSESLVVKIDPELVQLRVVTFLEKNLTVGPAILGSNRLPNFSAFFISFHCLVFGLLTAIVFLQKQWLTLLKRTLTCNTRARFSTAGLSVSYKLGVRWYFCWRGPILNPRPVLDSSAQTTRGNQLDFFCKT